MMVLSITPASSAQKPVARFKAVPAQLSVPGTSNPFLAGQPDGSMCCGDSAPAESPVFAGYVIAGGKVTFNNTIGGVSYAGGTPTDGPGGNLGYTTSAPANNGIGGYTNAPVDALVGVFLSAASPLANPVTTLANLNDGTAPTTTPALQQVFYIGNVGAGFSVTPPAGATRLYLGTVDGSGWSNNTGAISLTASGVFRCPSTARCL